MCAETGRQRICSRARQKVWTSASGLCAALHVDWLSGATLLSDSSTWGSIKVIRPEETAISITLVPCYSLVVSREQRCSKQLQCQTAFTIQLVNGTRWKNQVILSLRSLRNAEPKETQEEESGALACMPDLGQTIPLELFVCLLARWLACLLWVWFWFLAFFFFLMFLNSFSFHLLIGWLISVCVYSIFHTYFSKDSH